jgi:glycosyltransferase involved in cell wall biosynthesis
MQSPDFSIIVPVYNRPEEVRELLESLRKQTDKDFEVIIVEDGSTDKCEDICRGVLHTPGPGTANNEHNLPLRLKYFFKENEGPGLTRNYGAKKASGNYFIFFDSDCLIPADYISIVRASLKQNWLDCFGGPDRSHPSFTPVQKAISYSMTAFLTTGGIRGGDKKMDKFHPRSFNMGISREAFEKTGGYASMRFGEDLDMSLRIAGLGFKTGLIWEAYVYHKRRTDFGKFFKQVHNSGIARINLYKRHPQSLKAVHFIPALFVLYCMFSIIMLLAGYVFFIGIVIFYLLLIFIDSLRREKSLNIALLSVEATLVQHFGYGTGFIKAFWRRLILKQDEFHAYKKNFYK